MIEIDRDGPFISIYNAYDIKDELKKRGFRFDGILKCWKKEIRSKDELLTLCETLRGKEAKLLGGWFSKYNRQSVMDFFKKQGIKVE